jgi:guanosine-3',5'-bis(diphosphate) 3'-pyrophosphohydrolase
MDVDHHGPAPSGAFAASNEGALGFMPFVLAETRFGCKSGYCSLGSPWHIERAMSTMSTTGIQLGALSQLLSALRFAAEKHAGQQRKDQRTPYINHPISVTEALAGTGRVSDLAVLQAALLHDTLEDTPTTPEELDERFGTEVRLLVQEVTDDKSKPQHERRQLQIAHAPRLSPHAQAIRVADKLCNVLDITPTQPRDWSLQRKCAYLDWAETVVAACQGCNPPLEEAFRAAVKAKRDELGRCAGS